MDKQVGTLWSVLTIGGLQVGMDRLVGTLWSVLIIGGLQVGMDRQVGTLQLQPGGNTEGIYACVVSRDGVLELSHVFPVFRHATAIGECVRECVCV